MGTDPIEGLPSLEIHPRGLAHLGDAVYELFVRELAIQRCCHQIRELHQYTIARVNADFQAVLLHQLMPLLTEEEEILVKRGRNLPVPSGRRSNQAHYRLATGFEVLIGYLYQQNSERLQEIWKILLPSILEGKNN